MVSTGVTALALPFFANNSSLLLSSFPGIELALDKSLNYPMALGVSSRMFFRIGTKRDESSANLIRDVLGQLRISRSLIIL